MRNRNTLNLVIANDRNVGGTYSMQKEIVSLKAQLNLANDEIAELQDEIAIKTAARNAFEAQMMAFLAQHPDSPLNAKVGKSSKDGVPKSQIWEIWEVAFDASLKAFGFVNPASRRND